MDLVGIPSPLSATLDWLGDQAANAADETWEAVTEGMDDLADLAGQTWSLAEDGYDFAGETGDDVINILTDGYGTAADTASDLIDYVDDVLPDPPTFSGEPGRPFKARGIRSGMINKAGKLIGEGLHLKMMIKA